ncbi:MAG: elongation factor P [bacterium]|nr:elongation factor P [bacterium]
MDISKLKKGGAINWKHGVWTATDITFVNPGKGSAFFRIKLRNVETGQLVENTFKSGENLDEASMVHNPAQYLYNNGTNYTFMDNESYEQVELPAESLGNVVNFLKDNMEVKLTIVNGRAVGVQMPPKEVYLVTEAPPGVKGDSATGKTMAVTIETGATVQVPLFVKTGDKVRLNTETGEYVERVQ